MNKKNKKLLMVCGVLMSLAVALHVFKGFIDNDTLTDETTVTTENEISDDLIEIMIEPIILPDGTIVNPPETSEQTSENNIIADKDDFVVPQIDIPQVSIDKAQNILNNSNETYSADGLTVYQELQPSPIDTDESKNTNNSSSSSNTSSSSNNNSSSSSTNNTTSESSASTGNTTTNETSQEIPYNGHINENGEIYVLGFGYVPYSGENTMTYASDMYENGNKVGIM